MSTALEKQRKHVSEVRNAAVSFVGELDVGENLTGVPTAVEIGTTDLVITNVAISLVALTINDRAVPIGRAVQFSVSGGLAGTTYDVRVTATTDATPSQTLIVNTVLNVDGD